jgi:membrane-associated phospholipid phosphatase
LALVLALVIVPLGYFLRRQVRVGRWQTVDASEPGDRTALYLVAIPLLLALLLAATAFPVLVGLARGVAAVLAILVLAFLLNRWVKTSLHMAFAGYVAVACLASVRVVGVVLLVFLPLLAWARLAMGRHRPVEVVMGAALGLAVGIGALALG